LLNAKQIRRPEWRFGRRRTFEDRHECYQAESHAETAW
jgi:hypothetical protein